MNQVKQQGILYNWNQDFDLCEQIDDEMPKIPWYDKEGGSEDLVRWNGGVHISHVTHSTIPNHNFR